MADNRERYERPDDERCVSCRFFDLIQWESEPEVGVPEYEGYCRRLAPEPRLFTNENGGDVPEVAWPRVLDTDWCGEWQGVPRNVPRGTAQT